MLHLPILCYHHVAAAGKSPGYQRFQMSAARFEEQVSYLFHSGYLCLTLRDAAARWREKRIDRRTVILTFDDGYDSFYEIALPILCRYGFPATVFAVSGEVGGLSRWNPGSEAGLMGWSQLRELHRAGIEIGSHTVSHRRLSDLELAAVREEVKNSRAALEEKLGAPVKSFAYPFGAFNRAIEGLVQEAGYDAACSSLRGNLHTAGERYRLKRVPAHDFTPLARFRRRLSPLYDLTCRFQRWSRLVRGRVKAATM